MENRNGLRPRIYFSPGDIVRVKHEIENRPIMVVKSVDKIENPINGDSTSLLGVTCIWFDNNAMLQQYRFNTKDLEKVYTK